MTGTKAQNDSIIDEVIGGLLPGQELSGWLGQALVWIQANVLNLDVVIQFGLILGALVPAVILGPRLQQFVEKNLSGYARTGALRRAVNALAVLATPIVLYLCLALIRLALGGAGQPVNWVSASISLMNAWIVVRTVTLVIQSRFWSRVAFYVAWPIAALDAFGALGPVIEQMRALAITLGKTDTGAPIEFSLLDAVRTILYFAVLIWAANFLSKLLQQRIDAADELSPSLKALLGKIISILLPIIALILALQIAGFNLATLAVFSGAVGLGIGLGLQRIVSNFVAGFTLIADKSIKPYDVIEIDGTFGWVTAMQARYVAIRTRDGTEILIPNDRFMSEGVTNWSRTDRVVRLHAPFGVSYGTKDLRAVQELAVDVAKKVDRVIEQPSPVCNLMEYGDSSVNFDLRFWIADPQNGMANVRSAVLVALWERLREENIEIPFPQRDLHVRSWHAEARLPP